MIDGDIWSANLYRLGLKESRAPGCALTLRGRGVIDLIKNADTAMYQAKDKGRNTCRFFTEDMHTLAREQLFLENELRRALCRSDLTLHYQPQRILRFLRNGEG